MAKVNKTEAAKLIGVVRQTLYDYMDITPFGRTFQL